MTIASGEVPDGTQTPQMQLLAIGINHTTAPVSLRERVAFPLEQIKPALGALRTHLSGRNGTEAAILSTCNRTEIYCAGDQQALDHTLGWLAQTGGVNPSVLRSHAYLLQHDEVARHAFRVASGLDSMVLG